MRSDRTPLRLSAPNDYLLVVATAKDPLEVGSKGPISESIHRCDLTDNAALVTNETGPTRLLGTPVALKQK